jgi:hypothetical protein
MSSKPRAAGSARRKHVRWRRRITTAVILLGPFLMSIGLDVARRPEVLTALSPKSIGFYWGSALLTLLFWAALLWPTAQRRRAYAALFGTLFVILFTLVSGTQAAFWSCFQTLLTPDAEAYSRSWVQPWIGTLPLSRGVVPLHFLGSFLTAILFVRLARRHLRSTRWQRRLGAPLIAPDTLDRT